MAIPDAAARDWIAGIVAIALIALLGGALYALFRIQVPDANHDVLLVVIGMLTGSVATIVNYFYGSSKSDARKDTALASLAGAQQQSQSPAATANKEGNNP